MNIIASKTGAFQMGSKNRMTIFSKAAQTLGITKFLDLSILQYSKKLENTTFRNLDLFLSSGKGGKENT
jgi:hypothetical protein